MGYANRPRQHYSFGLDAQPRRLRFSFARRGTNPDSDSYTYGNTNTYSNTNSYADAYRYAQSYTETTPDSTSSSDAAAVKD
jgi:hypothetical protein